MLPVRNTKRHKDQLHVLSQQNVEDWSNEKNKKEIGKNKLSNKKKSDSTKRHTVGVHQILVTYKSFL